VKAIKAILLVLVLGLVALGIELWSRQQPGRARSLKMAHAYSAPHGGTIVQLGRDEFHLELVHDPAAGKLIVYLLDHEAKQPVRARSTSFDLVVKAGGEARTLNFMAIANPAGAASTEATRFEAQAEWLKTTRRFEAELPYLKIGSTTFLRQTFRFPEGNEKP
jgi:hypothetical protein